MSYFGTRCPIYSVFRPSFSGNALFYGPFGGPFLGIPCFAGENWGHPAKHTVFWPQIRPPRAQAACIRGHLGLQTAKITFLNPGSPQKGGDPTGGPKWPLQLEILTQIYLQKTPGRKRLLALFPRDQSGVWAFQGPIAGRPLCAVSYVGQFWPNSPQIIPKFWTCWGAPACCVLCGPVLAHLPPNNPEMLGSLGGPCVLGPMWASFGPPSPK